MCSVCPTGSVVCALALPLASLSAPVFVLQSVFGVRLGASAPRGELDGGARRSAGRELTQPAAAEEPVVWDDERSVPASGGETPAEQS